MSEIHFNPFNGDEEYFEKDPKDMSPAELKMLLHIKKLNLRLDLERIQTKINYTKLIIEAIKELGILDDLSKFTSHLESE